MIHKYKINIDKLKICYKVDEDIYNSIAAQPFQNRGDYQLFNIVEDTNNNKEIINIKTAVSVKNNDDDLLLGYLTMGHNRKI